MTPDVESDSGLEARYANLFKVGQNPTEFLIQFGQFQTGSPVVWLARMVLTPPFAKELSRMISDSIERYEATYGTIRVPGSSVEDK